MGAAPLSDKARKAPLPARLRDEAKRLWRERRRLAVGLVVAGILAVLGAGILAYELVKRPPDVHNPNAVFVPQKPPKPKAKTVNWPIYGLNTGLGAGVDTRLAGEEMSAFQRRVLLGRAVAIGPRLATDQVRAMIAARSRAGVGRAW